MRLDISWKLDRSPPYFALWNANAESMRSDQDINNSGASTLVRWATVQRAIDNYRQWIVAALDIFNDDGGVRPDLDNLYAGNAESITGVSDTQRRTVMTHWIAAGANLIVGSDLARLDRLGLELLTSADALAVAGDISRAAAEPRHRRAGRETAAGVNRRPGASERPGSGGARQLRAGPGPGRIRQQRGRQAECVDYLGESRLGWEPRVRDHECVDR